MDEPADAPARPSAGSEQPVRTQGNSRAAPDPLTGLFTYFLLLRLLSPPRPPSALRLPLMFLHAAPLFGGCDAGSH